MNSTNIKIRKNNEPSRNNRISMRCLNILVLRKATMSQEKKPVLIQNHAYGEDSRNPIISISHDSTFKDIN